MKHRDISNPITLDGFTAQITGLDIAESISCDHEACALARAISREFPGHSVFVDDYLEITHKPTSKYIDIMMSDDLIKWIDAFDNKKNVQPISLVITAKSPKGLIISITKGTPS